MNRDGLFSSPLSIGVGDPFIDRARLDSASPHGTVRGVAQFKTSPSLSSSLSPGGSFHRLYEGEVHIDPAKISARDRLKGKEKFLLPTGFRYSSPLKKSGSLGDYYGTFTKPIPHMPDGTGGVRGRREAIKEFPPKNIFTQPPKRASGSQATTAKICFTEVEYVHSPYDAALMTERELHRIEQEKMGGRGPFKVSVEEILTKPLSDAPSPQLNRTAPLTSRRPVTTDDGEHRAFRPSSPAKLGGAPYGTIGDYPSHLTDPYDEKKTRAATQSTRLLPMATQREWLEEKIRDRKSWTPSSPPKSMFTKSTLFHTPGK